MSMTAPWDPAAPAALRNSLRHVATVTVAGVTAEVESGRVTFDESWSPHVQTSNITCRVPTDVDDLDSIDPRADARVVIDAGYIYAGGRRDVHTLADLGIRVRDISRPGNTLTVNGYSNELRSQDATPLGVTLTVATGTTVTAAIAEILLWQIDAAVSVSASSVTTLPADVVVTTGDSVWSTVTDLADRIEAWLYVDGSGAWHLVDRPVQASTSAHVMSVGPIGNIEEVDSSLSVDEWGNAVLVTWRDGVKAWGTVTDTSISPPAAPLKVRSITRDGDAPTTATDRAMVVESLMRRVYSRGRGYMLVGPAAYWLRPGMTITVTLTTGGQQRHLVSRVEFELATGTMTVRTRVPEDAPVTTGE